MILQSLSEMPIRLNTYTAPPELTNQAKIYMKYLFPFPFLWLFTLPSLAQIAQVEHQQAIINNKFIPLMVDLAEDEDPMLIGKAIKKKTTYYSREKGVPVVGAVESGLDIEMVNFIEFPEGEGSYYSSFARQGGHCFFPINFREPGSSNFVFEIFEINEEGEPEERYPLFERKTKVGYIPVLDGYEVIYLSYRSKDHRYLGILEFVEKTKRDLSFNVTVFDTQEKAFWTEEIELEDTPTELSKLLSVYLSTRGTFHVVLSTQEE